MNLKPQPTSAFSLDLPEMAEARLSLPHGAAPASRHPATRLEESHALSRHKNTNSAFEPSPIGKWHLHSRWQFV
jgi:hypothetical protein